MESSRRGRPKKSPEEALRNRVVAKLNDSDFAALREWSKERGVQMGELVREILERAARRKARRD